MPKRHMKGLVASLQRNGPVDRVHAHALETPYLGSGMVNLNAVGNARPGSAVDVKDAEEDLVCG